jgi:hypothetical protein
MIGDFSTGFFVWAPSKVFSAILFLMELGILF